MIKDLRDALDISITELAFVLDVNEKQIEEWEISNQIPENIIKVLQKRYNQYFCTNDKGDQVFKKKDNGSKSKGTRLDKLLEGNKKLFQKSKKSKKIIVKKKKNKTESSSSESSSDDESHQINDKSSVIVKESKIKQKLMYENGINKSNVLVKDREVDKELKHNGIDNDQIEENIITSNIIKAIVEDRKDDAFSSLRDIRKYLKVSQTELGEALDINQRKISIWEITNAKIPKEVIEKISEYYKLSLEKISHLIEPEESNYQLEKLPINKDSIFYNKEIDSLDIQAIRKTFGHSLRSFADEIGVHYQTVARWEKGNGIPKDYILKDIIEKFLNRKNIKELIDKGINVGLKEEYAHWKTEEEVEEEHKDTDKLIKNIDKKMEILNLMENGMEVDNVNINSKKNITIINLENNFKATLILNDSVIEKLKKIID